MNSSSPLGYRSSVPLWLPNAALVLTLLIALLRAGSVSTVPFALVIAVLAVLHAGNLALAEKECSLAWNEFANSPIQQSALIFVIPGIGAYSLVSKFRITIKKF